MTPATVYDDGEADILTGSQASDWFFANLVADSEDDVLDKVTDLSSWEDQWDIELG